ncbi:MAG: chorismate synthase [Gracilibacter sp. BRH_c7a]|nr:MAG: chorismate synthase [Gracilibacter sp. BRH_c7a]
MSGTWGECLELSIFGESHGPGVGIVVNGLPAGIELDLDLINMEMGRRMPGKTSLATPRQEKDKYELVGGYFNSKTTGSPLCCMIWNQDQRSLDYEDIKGIVRPSHADFTARWKHAGFNDYRGGGHFSGRLTAPLVFAGAIAKQLLAKKGIVIGSHILSIGEVQEEPFDLRDVDFELLKELTEKEFPVIIEDKAGEMKDRILEAKKDEDSVGGVIEVGVANLPIGLGSPFFDSAESKIAHLLFSIPAVKGVEFGAGFHITKMKGSEANDGFILEDNQVRTTSNNNGGILGGITNGMPLVFRAAFKPTPSIGKVQRTVDVDKMEEVEISIKGRHDPCIVPRAVPVVEAAAALALLDLMIEKDGTGWMS